MPVIEGPATAGTRLGANIRVPSAGSCGFKIEIQPRFDYGRKPTRLEAFDHGGGVRAETWS